jgi:GR25 family glycosyltransferase involved in LPS biosynthesis
MVLESYVISLDAARFGEAAAELAPYGLAPSHFQAVRGAALSAAELAGAVSADARVHLRDGSGDLPSLGAVGCYLSHVALWRFVVACGRTALVFEDDVLGLASPSGVLPRGHVPRDRDGRCWRA